MTANRQCDFVSAGLEEAEANEDVEKFASVEDEEFEQIVGLMKKKDKKEEDETEEEAAPAMGKKAAEETEEETDEAVAEAEGEVIEEAEEVVEAALAETADDDPVAELRSSASEWFGALLKSTPKAE